MASNPPSHPVYQRLTCAAQAFSRHVVLHELDQRAHEVPGSDPLARRVHHFVERGVPYFAPEDAHYLDWAAHAAALWTELDARAARQVA